ncbi:signal peptidase II [Maritimibacter dapengensis]|uniref:Lipoprotein signal peptidase n=1 Tax=Maritimibacter dapengensis TaxID=2836868 RepID=A0ABS6SYG4_9RHOB|nr:signal peptidase II [Maritimibacter dapengensis]MBV7377336.1 signal peptidase II [Maritimibacter dapengensis]
MRGLWITAAIVFVVDQATKWLVVQYLNLKEVGAIDVIPPILNLRMAWNEGINFGLFSDAGDARRWILIGVAVVIIAAVLYWVRRDRMQGLALISAGVLVGGALGNVIDRLIYGAVADFLNMSCCGIQNPYSFNLADIAVFAGAIGLILFAKPQQD